MQWQPICLRKNIVASIFLKSRLKQSGKESFSSNQTSATFRKTKQPADNTTKLLSEIYFNWNRTFAATKLGVDAIFAKIPHVHSPFAVN